MAERNWSRGTSRRTVLKTTAASIAGLSGVSSLTSLGRGAEGSDPQPVTDPEPAPAPDIYIGPDLREFNWLVLLGNERDSMADALTRYVDNASVNQKQKDAARESLKDIWSEIEIKSQTKPWHVIQKQQEKRNHERTKTGKQGQKQGKQKIEKEHGPGKKGKTTVYSLKREKSSIEQILARVESSVQNSRGVRTASKQKSEASGLPHLSNIINSGMSGGQTEDGSVIRPMWYPSPSHKKITKAAVNNWYTFDPPMSAEQIGEWSTWPDEPKSHDEITYNLVVPDWFPVDVFPDKAAEAYAHAFNPHYDAVNYVSPGPVPTGAGPDYTDRYMSTAITEQSYKHLGFALHIIEDLAVPFHTGAWGKGTLLSSAQSRYEKAVNRTIEDEYLDQLESIENCVKVPDPPLWDPDSRFVKHAKNISNRSTEYAHSFATKVTECDEDSPDKLIEACGIGDQTQQLLDWATMYAMGLIREFKFEVQ